ncbi:MAG TPA: LytTR family DNA-binding domain-containing protein [Blastocatellia bacterium]|nr:LytTR family DNA-binding domain-containing protein [Blastocatellia bacterium]
MEKIRALIVDDEPLAREGIRMRLKQEPDVEVIGACKNGREAVTAILRDVPDLVFLDIQMPRLDGFGVIEAVSVRQMPHVIFVTAYDEHALRAFEVSALDYLLKPIDGARFSEALERVRSRIRGENLEAVSERLNKMMASLGVERSHLERLSIKSAGRITFIDVDEIDWIEAADNYVQVHSGRESHLLHATMNSLESRLDPNKFLRIHRSIIVNVSRIKELHPMFHGGYRVILKDGAQLTSGRRYRENLQKLLNDL